jgi:hypothetical protein
MSAWLKNPVIPIFLCIGFLIDCRPVGVESVQQDTINTPEATATAAAQWRTVLGENILLQPGEYCVIGSYLSYNPSSNILLFETENGGALELVSPVWSRTGHLQLTQNHELRPKVGTKYELIYRKVPSQSSPSDTALFLIDIITTGGIFHESMRYQTSESENFQLPKNAAGSFTEDILDDGLECKLASGLPELYLKLKKTSETIRLNLTVINSHILMAEAENKNAFYLRFQDNNWEYIALTGNRRVFRKLVQ